MAPIRVALIGLSSSSPSWLSLAHLPYLLSAKGQQKFQIVALQNSSLSAAEAAIKKYNFDPTVVKAYGSPEDLAKDEDVDLVVVGTRVDVHYGNLKGVLEGWRKAIGKTADRGVYSEWPLASNLQQVEEVVALAKETGVKTVVGTQGWASPVVKEIGELLKGGRVGKVLSSEVRLSGLTAEREAVQEKLEYFTQREVGGNLWSVGGGHLIDLLQSSLGELTNVKSHFHIQRPLVPLKDNATNTITRTVTSNTPDLLYVVGSLPASDTVQQNASLHLRMRRGPPFPGEPAFVWTLTGEKGEIRVTSKESVAIFLGAGEVKIEVHDYQTDKVEEVEWKWQEWQEELPAPARNVGSVYEGVWEAWTEGITSKEDGKKRYNDWEVAGRRHELVERLLVDNGF